MGRVRTKTVKKVRIRVRPPTPHPARRGVPRSRRRPDARREGDLVGRCARGSRRAVAGYPSRAPDATRQSGPLRCVERAASAIRVIVAASTSPSGASVVAPLAGFPATRGVSPTSASSTPGLNASTRSDVALTRRCGRAWAASRDRHASGRRHPFVRVPRPARLRARRSSSF